MKKKLLIILLVVLVVGVGLFVFRNFINKPDNTEKEVSNLANNQENLKEDEDQIYFKVLKNEIKYVAEDNTEKLFKECMENYKEDTDGPKVKYTLFDLDNDSKNEMVVMIEAFNDGFYLILNNEDGTVYGFEEVYRGMKDIKTDGTFIGAGGASSYGVFRDKFEKNKIIPETLAEVDMDKYQIDGKDVSEDEFQKYMDEFDKKENVEFVTYIEKYEFDETSSDKSSDENSKENLSSENKVEENAVGQTKFEEGKYIMTKPSLVGTEAEGYDTTITFKDGKVSYLESYWGTKKNGTYSVQGDTLIIKYTSGNDVDSIEGDKGTIALNITEEYKIDGKEIIVQKASDNPYTTAGSIVYELSK